MLEYRPNSLKDEALRFSSNTYVLKSPARVAVHHQNTHHNARTGVQMDANGHAKCQNKASRPMLFSKTVKKYRQKISMFMQSIMCQ